MEARKAAGALPGQSRLVEEAGHAAVPEGVEEAVQRAVERALQMAVQMAVDTSWLADAKAAEP